MSNKFRKEIGRLGNQQGFTLIELIIVIVILGILAAVAIPKYQNIRAQATIAAADGVYGAANGAVAVNFAGRLVSPSGSTAITDGTSLAGALEGGLPDGWTAAAATHNALTGVIGGNTYHISIPTKEDPTGATSPTQRAVLRKDW